MNDLHPLFSRPLTTAASLGLALTLGCGANAAPHPSPQGSPPTTAELLRAEAHPVSADGSGGLDRVLDWMGNARVVLLGEASHGTHEFYALRAALTRRLVAEGGLDAVLLEADHASAARLDRYVRGLSDDPDAATALGDFERFPGWMWRNEVVVELVEWLHDHNAERPPDERVRIAGIDLYGPAASADAVVAHLAETEPEAAARMRARLDCLVGDGDAPGAMTARLAENPGCLARLDAAVAELGERSPGDPDAMHSAHVVRAAARYWITELSGAGSSWNVRDLHMADTTDRLLDSLSEPGDPARVAIWAHNSHLGDARVTSMADRGEHNLGQLLRERHGDEVFGLGFATFTGELTAADRWGTPGLRKTVLPGRDDSYEGLLHRVGLPLFALDTGDAEVRGVLDEPRITRAIGVVYRPQTELYSHYGTSQLSRQFDAVIFVDRSTALRPLEPGDGWLEGPDASS